MVRKLAHRFTGLSSNDYASPLAALGPVLIASLAVALGAAYVWVVKPGLPYDEPAHWSTVLFYTHHAHMPVLGKPGVTYEAQMGPVAYVVDAALVRGARAVGLPLETAFRLVRMLGVLELAVGALIVSKLVKRLVSSWWPSSAAVAVFAMNPMLLTMSGSVQNDTLALLLGLLALELTLEKLSEVPQIGSAVAVGVVAGLALLTKLTASAGVAAIVAWLVWRHRRSAVRPLLALVGSVFAVSGWWFIRNIVLYADPTAAAGVSRTGASFAPYRPHGVSGVAHILEQVVTYLWLPTEYARNLISAPVTLKGGLLAITAAVLLVGLAHRDQVRQRGALVLISTCGVVSFASWLVTYLGTQAVAPRVAYMALPLWFMLVALAMTSLPMRISVAIVGVGLVSLNAWTLHELSGVGLPSFITFSP